MELLTVLVGSRAHGLATETSDYDYHSVYALPYVERVKKELGMGGPKPVWSVDRGNDHTLHEIGEFLRLSLKCSPTILECFVAPVKFAQGIGWSIPDLFPYVWNSDGVKASFLGYSKNQMIKYAEDPHGKRGAKYAIAALRGVYIGTAILREELTSLEVPNEIKDLCNAIRNGGQAAYPPDVLSKIQLGREKIIKAYEDNPDYKADSSYIVDWLIELRQRV